MNHSANVKKLFDEWARCPALKDPHKQWLLSKWENIEGVDWPDEKIRLMMESIRRRMDFQKSHRVLDLGCGGGWLAKEILPDVRGVVGLDFSSVMLEHAREVIPQVPLIQAKIEQLPMKDNSWDRVLCYFVFINIMNDDDVYQGIREIHRVLKDGGRALIGQLPDENQSGRYDSAKKEYLAYCRAHFATGNDLRDVCRIPQKLFDRKTLSGFLSAAQIPFEFHDSFNPFYYPGKPSSIPWRFDLVLVK